MPPTRAAAMNTACGRTSSMKRSTCAASRRSQVARGAVTISQFSLSSRRISADPTRPRCPATQTRLFRSSYRWDSEFIGFLSSEFAQVGFDHFLDQLLKAGLVLPAEFPPRLFRIAEQQVHFGRSVVGRVDSNQNIAGPRATAGLITTLASPRDRPSDIMKGALDEFAHGMGFAGREHIVVGLALLQNPPHAVDIVARMPPIALRVDVAEIEPLLQAALDGGHGARDLARDEGFAANGRFMIE